MESSEMPTPVQSPTRGYVDVARLENSDGIVAVISQRRKTGVLTFTIFREFSSAVADETGTGRTGFMTESLFESFLAMANLTKQRMVSLRSEGKLPFPVKKV
jgi:hypothetical protein